MFKKFLILALLLCITNPASVLAHGNGKGHHKYNDHHKKHTVTYVYYDPYRAANYPNRVRQEAAAAVIASVLANQRNYGIPRYRIVEQQQIVSPMLVDVQVGRRLPPGIAKKVYYLPASSYSAIGVPYGYRASVYNDTLILMNAAGIVVDLIKNIM